MPALQVVAAETDAEARRLFTSTQQSFCNMQRGRPGPLPPPIDDIEAYWSAEEKARVTHMFMYAVVGSPATVRDGLSRFIQMTGADEVMMAAGIYDHDARLKSFEIAADAMRALA
jgi:alkanesulfonate monooxygenase SsuD/methylene tetrahydromethanopterin reductase-like flavin-dependent oxidoreductase (luciferase family)